MSTSDSDLSDTTPEVSAELKTVIRTTMKKHGLGPCTVKVVKNALEIMLHNESFQKTILLNAARDIEEHSPLEVTIRNVQDFSPADLHHMRAAGTTVAS